MSPSVFAGRRGLTIPSSIFPYWWHHVGHTRTHTHTPRGEQRALLYHVRDCLSCSPVSMCICGLLKELRVEKAKIHVVVQKWTDNPQCKGALYHWTFQIQSGSGADCIDGRKGIFTPPVCRPSRGDLLPMWVTLTEPRHEWGGRKMDGSG